MNEFEVVPGREGKPRGSCLDRVMPQLAARQHDVVARWQLIARGVKSGSIEHWIEVGRLRPVHRGVYAFGHAPLTQRGWWMAAVLAGGDGAVLSHRSAAALWGLGRPASRVDVTIPARRARRRGIRLVTATIAEDERTVRDGIPVTTVARTLLDLAAVVRADQLERAMREAEVRSLGDRTPLAALLARHRGRRGTARIHAILARKVIGSGRTKSELEEAFLRFLDRRRMPRPLLNQTVEGGERDCVWMAARLVAELDGREFHDGEDPFDTDRRRDRRLQARGWHTVRVTWRHLEEDARDLEADLRMLLASTTL